MPMRPNEPDMSNEHISERGLPLNHNIAGQATLMRPAPGTDDAGTAASPRFRPCPAAPAP